MYCKLFASLYQGTLRGRSDEILVFTNLLAHTSAAGEVDKHFRAIAEETGLSVDRVKQAIVVLESPDEESRSPDEEGARLVRLDEHRVWGWRVVNHGKYRAYKNEADRAEKNREAQARFRENKRRVSTGESNGGVMNSNGRVMARNESNGSKPIQIQEADTETEAVTPLPPRGDLLELDSEMAAAPKPPRQPKTDHGQRIHSLFHRGPRASWSDKELKALRKLEPFDTEDFALVESYYRTSGNAFLRTEVQTFLNNYQGEVDKARLWRKPVAVPTMESQYGPIINRWTQSPS
jgi:hypothetical protein